MFKKYGLIFLLFLFPSLSANAKLVTFACPDTQNISFKKIGDSDQYLAKGFVRLIDGETPVFMMQGLSSSNHVEELISAHFVRKHLFCLYRFLKNGISHSLTLENLETPGLEYCYFQDTKNNACEAHINHCFLRCEIL